MSEPFDINESPDVNKRSATQAKPTFWDQLVTASKSLWKQTLVIGRKSETVVQLPLVIAIALGVMFPYLAALVLVLGIVFGYSFTVLGK